MRKCQHKKCNKEFDPRRKDQVFCCNKCSKRASDYSPAGVLRQQRRCRIRDWRKHGIVITIDEYKERLLSQQSKCLICHKESAKDLGVDHNHTTGKIRGLLCNRCNLGIGMFGDDIRLLQSAIDYLQSHESPNKSSIFV